MSVTTDFRWNGDQVKLKGRRVVNKSAFEIGLVVEGQAKVLVNNVTGRLAGSITTRSRTESSSPDSPATSADVITAPADPQEVLVGTAVEYGPYVEYGTRRSNARPFLRPAFDLAQGRTLTLMRKNGLLEFGEYLS